jgi:hypothetical protein
VGFDVLPAAPACSGRKDSVPILPEQGHPAGTDGHNKVEPLITETSTKIISVSVFDIFVGLWQQGGVIKFNGIRHLSFELSPDGFGIEQIGWEVEQKDPLGLAGRSLGYLTAAFASAEDFLQSNDLQETTCLAMCRCRA